MNWLIFATLAALSWALVNNLDKIVVTRFVKSPLGIVVIEGLLGFVISLFLVREVSLLTIPVTLIIICILAGFLLYLFNYLYYKAIEKSDPTVVVILMQTVPFFTFLWGSLFFQESFSVPVYIGCILIVIGGVLATFEKRNNADAKKKLGTISPRYL